MSINLNTNTAFIQSKDIRVFPCANRGWNNEGNPYDIESKLNTERNNILALGSNPYNSYIISYKNSTLKFVLHGYYFEINGFETEKATAAAVYAKIKLTPTTIAGTTTTLVLSDVDTAVTGTNDSSLDILINNEYYFKGLKLLTAVPNETNNYLDISSSIKRSNSFMYRKISNDNSATYSEEYIMFLGKFEEDNTSFKPNLKAFLPVFENAAEYTESTGKELLESGITFPNNVSIKGPNTRIWGNVTLHKSSSDAKDNFIVNTNTTTINSKTTDIESDTFKVKDWFNIYSNSITNSLPTTLEKALIVDGSTTLNSTLTVEDETILKESATINSTLDVSGKTTLTGALETTSNTTLGKDDSNNKTTINDSLSTTNNITLGTSKKVKTLNVYNNTTFWGNTKVDKGLVITSNKSGLTGYTEYSLAVNGISSFNDNVYFNDNIYFNADVSLANEKQLIVNGTSTFNNDVSFNSLVELTAVGTAPSLTVEGSSAFNNNVSIKSGYNLSWGTNKTTINDTSLSTSTVYASSGEFSNSITSKVYKLSDSNKFELTSGSINNENYGKVKGLWLDNDNYINLSTSTVFTYNLWVENNGYGNNYLIANRTNPNILCPVKLISDEDEIPLTTDIGSDDKCFLGFDTQITNTAINLIAGKINQKLLPNTVLQIDTTTFNADIFGQKTMFPVRDWTSSATTGRTVTDNTNVSRSALSLPLLFGYNTVNLTADILPGIQNTATRYSKKLRFYPEYTSNVSALYLDGLMYATTFIATSDERKKENIINYKPKNSILDLPVHEFDFKETKQHDIGCIAQELKELFPELVKEDSEGYLAIQETKLIYPLLLEVKKLKEKIEELEKKI